MLFIRGLNSKCKYTILNTLDIIEVKKTELKYS